MLEALQTGAQVGAANSCFVGSVRYLTGTAILQEIANAIGNMGLDIFAQPSNRANLLLVKREAFAHEAELRLIRVSHESNSSTEPIVRVPIDPNVVFDEISFDPRLAIFERKEREETIRNLGYKGSFRESALYQRVLMQVLINTPPKLG